MVSCDYEPCHDMICLLHAQVERVLNGIALIYILFIDAIRQQITVRWIICLRTKQAPGHCLSQWWSGSLTPVSHPHPHPHRQPPPPTLNELNAQAMHTIYIKWTINITLKCRSRIYTKLALGHHNARRWSSIWWRCQSISSHSADDKNGHVSLMFCINNSDYVWHSGHYSKWPMRFRPNSQ